MSIETTKANLIRLIEAEDNKVIALTGKWGTGKTFLWDGVKANIKASSAKNPLYVSLFGIKNVEQLKLRLVQNALPYVDDETAGKKKALSVLTYGRSIASKFQSWFSVLEDAAQITVPWFLEKRFIVIDDIERKNEKLSIDEVMGFINEYTNVYKARFLLILNSNQLGDEAMWTKLREKVIDHEIALVTTPEEAANIALGNVVTAHAPMIQSALKICGITNIRIAQKIIRAVNQLLDGRTDLTDDVKQRVIPSTVLLGGIYYKGIENGPDVNFVLKFNSTMYYMEKHQREKEHIAETEQDSDEAQWVVMLNELGIDGCDEYEVLVLDFLKDGLLDVAKTDAIFQRYVSERDLFLASTRYKDFSEKTLWNPELSNEDLFAEAEDMMATVHLLNAYEVTALHYVVSQLPDGQEVADRLIQQWLTKYREGPPHGFDVDRILQREIHPDIETEFEANRNQLQPLPSMFEVCQNIGKNSGWGRLEELAMQASTPEQYETEIRNLGGRELKILMLKNVELYVQRAAYPQFVPAIENFAAACRSIYQRNDNPRRTDLIKKVFKHSGIESVLEVEEAVAQPPIA